MDVNRLNAIQPLSSGSDRREQPGREEEEKNPRPGPSGAERGGAPGGEREADAVSVMGIPPNEMTPSVQRAISLLLEEISSLRRELTKSREHEAYLERNVDEHPTLPVLGRRGFVQRLQQIITRSRKAEVSSCFLYLHVLNAEDVRTRIGAGAEDALLLQVARVLNREFGDDAVVGFLDNADFGVILPAAGADEGGERIRRALSAIGDAGVSWEGDALVAEMLHGITLFDGGGDAESVLAAADRDLIERKKRHGA